MPANPLLTARQGHHWLLWQLRKECLKTIRLLGHICVDGGGGGGGGGGGLGGDQHERTGWESNMTTISCFVLLLQTSLIKILENDIQSNGAACVISKET